MLYKKPPVEKTGVEKAIDEVLTEMQGFSADDDEYAKMVTQLQKLNEIKALDKPHQVSPDTLAIIAGNLIGIVLIVGYERANVLTSKALIFLRQLK